MKPGFLSSLAALWLTACSLPRTCAGSTGARQARPQGRTPVRPGNNFTIRQARERIKQQEGVEIEVRARLLPNVAAGGSYTFNDREISQYMPQSDRTWSIALQARQVLYAGGGVQASVKSARLVREAAVLELQVSSTSSSSSCAPFLHGAPRPAAHHGGGGKCPVARGTVEKPKSRLDAGATSNSRCSAPRSRLANGRPPLIQARNDFRLAIEELRQALGYVNSRGERRCQGSGVSRFARDRPTGRISIARCAGHRPGQPPRVAAPRQTHRLRRSAGRGVARQRPARARSDRFLQRGAGSFSPGWASRLDGLAGGLQVQWNIWDGRATAGRIAQANRSCSKPPVARRGNARGGGRCAPGFFLLCRKRGNWSNRPARSFPRRRRRFASPTCVTTPALPPSSTC